MSQSEDDSKEQTKNKENKSQDKAEEPSQEQQPAQTEAKPEEKPKTPAAATPQVARPVVGRPIGSVPAKPAAPVGVTRSTVVTPIATRPSVGTPAARPSVGTPTVARPPATGPPVAGKPTVPPKPTESRKDVSRRNFLRLLAVAGGLVALGQFAQLGPYLTGSVKVSQATTQQILDAKTGQPIKTTDVAVNDWKIFVYPRTGNSNVDNDTFSQCVVIHLPRDLSAPSNLSIKDPITGDTFIAFSRVCVHLWCLWTYVPGDRRMECPCHGSQYVPGTGAYPAFSPASDKAPGFAVAGPASLQIAPNNQLPVILLTAAPDGTLSATGIVGQIGCGQNC